nr:MAG TPA: hypothetical protein [Caudoviricetes sp.]
MLKCYCGNGRERSKSHLSTQSFLSLIGRASQVHLARFLL